MHTMTPLSDHQHPAIQAKADELTSEKSTHLDQVESIFAFVRDEILFGFPPKWDEVKASETLQYGKGYCNTKATLFLALCQAADIPARIHTGLIDIRIMHGIFPALVFPFLPSAGGHTWTEVQVDGAWRPIDTYINDRPFYEGALIRLHESGRTIGFSVCEVEGPSTCAFNLGDRGFVHMGAVLEDHGAWGDFSDYMASEKYLPMSRVQLTAYPMLARIGNQNIERIRL